MIVYEFLKDALKVMFKFRELLNNNGNKCFREKAIGSTIGTKLWRYIATRNQELESYFWY